MPRVNSEQHTNDQIRRAIMGKGLCEWTEEPCDRQRAFSIYYREQTPGIRNSFSHSDKDGIESVVWKELSRRGTPMRVCNYHEGMNATRLGFGRKAIQPAAKRGRPRKGGL
tara:strand:+ start:121 stop:453 length:333 start_codon:yes stop_codon:yes gene_type:complete